MGIFTQAVDDRQKESGSFSKFIRKLNMRKEKNQKALINEQTGKPYISTDGTPISRAGKKVGEKKKKAVDIELEYLRGLVEDGYAPTLATAISYAEKESGMKWRSLPFYTGRQLKLLDETGMQPEIISSMVEKLDLPYTAQQVKDYGLARRTLGGVRRVSAQVTHGAVSTMSALKTAIPQAGKFYANELGIGDGVSPYGNPKESTKGNLYDPDSSKVILDEVVEKIDAEEMIWKTFNAVADEETPSGLDLPYNIGGGVGETLLGMVVDFNIARRYKTFNQQMVNAIKANTAIEAGRYSQHDNELELGVGVASNVLGVIPGVNKLPFMNKHKAGLGLGNLAMFGERGTRKKELLAMTPMQKDRHLNMLKLNTEDAGISVPHNVLYRSNKTKNKLKTSDGVKGERRGQLLNNMKRVVDKYEQTSVKYIADSLNTIGASAKSLVSEVPDGTANPLSYLTAKYFKNKSKELTSLGSKQDKLWKANSKGLRVPMSKIVEQSKSFLKDRSAIAHFNSAYRTVTGQQTEPLSKQLSTLQLAKTKLMTGRNPLVDNVTTYANELKVKKTRLNELLASDKSSDSAILGAKENVRKAEIKVKSNDKALKTSIESENAYKTSIDDIKNNESLIDMDIELTAEQSVDLVKELNQEIAGSQSMLGGMKENTKSQLNGIKSLFKDEFKQLPEEFSVPYFKANEYYATNFKMLDRFSGTNPSGIKGLGDAIDDESGVALTKLFSGDEGLLNLKKLGYWMPTENTAYKSLVRTHMESNMNDSVFKAGEEGFKTFNPGALVTSYSGVDFDDYRMLLPIDSSEYKAVDTFSGVVGTASQYGENLSETSSILRNIDTDARKKIGVIAEFRNTSLQNFGFESSFPSSPKAENSWDSLFPSRKTADRGPLGPVIDVFKKMSPVDELDPVYRGVDVDAETLSKAITEENMNKHGFPFVKPADQSVGGLNILTLPKPIDEPVKEVVEKTVGGTVAKGFKKAEKVIADTISYTRQGE